MAHLSTLWSFSAILIITLCSQSSARSTNPESDTNCIHVESVTKEDRSWNVDDRVYICQNDGQDLFDIYSYTKKEEIASFGSPFAEFEEQWALSIRFTVRGTMSTSQLQCTFSKIEQAQAFYRRVRPGSRISPQNFTLPKLERITVRNGKGEGRRPAALNPLIVRKKDPLILHQRDIDSDKPEFAFVSADRPAETSPLTFWKGEFQVKLFKPYKEMILSQKFNEASCFILNFGDKNTNAKFIEYMASFVGPESDYTFPEGYNR